MNNTSYENAQTGSQRASLGSALSDILHASKKRRVVIRNRSGNKVIDTSVLLALFLSIGAPVIPVVVIVGVLVEAIRVSIEERQETSETI